MEHNSETPGSSTSTQKRRGSLGDEGAGEEKAIVISLTADQKETSKAKRELTEHQVSIARGQAKVAKIATNGLLLDAYKKADEENCAYQGDNTWLKAMYEKAVLEAQKALEEHMGGDEKAAPALVAAASAGAVVTASVQGATKHAV